MNATVKQVVGSLDEISKLKNDAEKFSRGGLDDKAKAAAMRGLPGLENDSIKGVLEKAEESVFKALDSVVEKVGQGNKTAKVFGEMVMKTGFYGELITAKTLEYSGLFESNTLGALQNNSNQGMDLFGKARTGKFAGQWLAMEVKSSDNGWAPQLSNAQMAGSNAYATSRLRTAVGGGARWVPGQSVDQSVVTYGKQILRDSADYKIGGFAVFNSYIGTQKPKVQYVDWSPKVSHPAAPWGTSNWLKK